MKSYASTGDLTKLMNSALLNVGAIHAPKGLDAVVKSYASTGDLAKKMNSALLNVGAIHAPKGLDAVVKSYASTGDLTKLMNSAFLNVGAIPAMQSMTVGLDAVMKSYASTSDLAEKMNSAFLKVGTVPAMESMTIGLDSIMKSYASTGDLTKLVNSTLLTAGAIPAMESMTKGLDSIVKSYEPLMSSVVSQLDMSSLFTEVSKNFNLADMAAYTDVSTFGQALVGKDFLDGIISKLDFEIYDPVDGVVEHSSTQDQHAGEDSRAVAVRNGIYILSVLIFVSFLLPYIAMFCVASAKEIADLGLAILDQANHLSEVAKLGGVSLIETTGRHAVSARNRVKKKNASAFREADVENTPDS
jgi:uncharacterized protein YsxB (DUF464 family)